MGFQIEMPPQDATDEQLVDFYMKHGSIPQTNPHAEAEAAHYRAEAKKALLTLKDLKQQDRLERFLESR